MHKIYNGHTNSLHSASYEKRKMIVSPTIRVLKNIFSLIVLVICACCLSSCQNSGDELKNALDEDNTILCEAYESERIIEQTYEIMRSSYLWRDYARSRSVDPACYGGAQVKEFVKLLQSPEDRFTFIITAEESGFLQGRSQDPGLMMRYLGDTLWVAFVEPNSIAKEEGLERGQWIKSVTPQGESELIVTPAPEAYKGSTRAFSASIGSIKVEISGCLKDIRLAPTSYDLRPVFLSKILSVGAEKVGYLVLTNFFGADTYKYLNGAFERYRSEGVEHLVIDFRYNRGGLLGIAKDLLNQIYNPGNPEIMYRLSHHPSHRHLDKIVHFSENQPALNPTHVYFLIHRATASASELVINALKPFANISIFTIGETSRGKNVGSYVRLLPDSRNYTHSFFPISFRLANKDDESDYANGFTPDFRRYDDVRHVLGDPKEAMLAAALHYVRYGSFRPPPNAASKELEKEGALIDTRQISKHPTGLYIRK